ncbi:ATP-dependent RNA helicase dbp9 [Penicillium hispanicum]|uniref:ATP-dependent RNA helicase dbp9 n=1 Tax=Penicillium hispanicum TaxID=1080232 RepID=UPI0025404A2E|nr:ATP-dependent RNA helicase dbp9 [Penicillium hispanicum]KAJ5595258.1 ATP-dependent RNA helicase dbp9 [Penicillium hispanicum]
MKRKLDANDVPSPKTSGEGEPKIDFETLGLDARLRQALIKEKFTKPTPVQAKAIPLALEGKDIFANSKTGSGKTAAYVLPILQAILQRKDVDDSSKAITALILVPSLELGAQVQKVITSFTAFCGKAVRSINLAQKIGEEVQRTMLADIPDVVVSTPSRVVNNINNSTMSLDKLTHLVIDEADQVLSFGYDDDMNILSKALPRGVQTFLMSATLGSEVDTLKSLFCRNPVVLELEDKEEKGADVSQFVVKCSEDDKFVLIYVILILKLIKGKILIFVCDVDRCYRLKLFLEQFQIKSCILNKKLPVNTRVHAVEQFNKGVYDIIIAADEDDDEEHKSRSEAKSNKKVQGTVEDEEAEGDEGDHASEEDEKASNSKQKSKPEKRRKVDGERRNYGIARGIDFQNVACVLNFDLPTTSTAYTHRIGRTGRAGKAGMALSFVIPTEEYGKHKPTSIPSAKNDEKVLAKIVKRQAKHGHEVKPYHFDMEEVKNFRYRVSDSLRVVTRRTVTDARTTELKQEVAKSEKLKRYFEENPEDLEHLRHDAELRTVRIQPHLKHVPDYLMPAKGRKGISKEDVGYVGFSKTNENRIRKARDRNRSRGKGKKPTGRKADPLKTFNRGRK